jgi:ankyrin repeat protein
MTMGQFDDLVEAIDEGNTALALRLIGTDPGLANEREFDEQAIHCAVRACNAEVVRALVRNGADINSPGNRGETPLHYAIRTRDFEMVRLILSYFPMLSAEDEAGITPLLLAARSGEPVMADELLRVGAKMDFHSAVALGRAGVVIEMLRQNPGIIGSVRYRNDLLPDAIYSDSLETVAVLLEQPEIDIHGHGLSGDPPLFAAVSDSTANPEIAKLLLRKKH